MGAVGAPLTSTGEAGTASWRRRKPASNCSFRRLHCRSAGRARVSAGRPFRAGLSLPALRRAGGHSARATRPRGGQSRAPRAGAGRGSSARPLPPRRQAANRLRPRGWLGAGSPRVARAAATPGRPSRAPGERETCGARPREREGTGSAYAVERREINLRSI